MMTKTDAVLDATQALRKADFTVEQADTQVRAIGTMTDHLASKSDLKIEIAHGTSKVILAMTGILIGALGLFFAALQIWPPS